MKVLIIDNYDSFTYNLYQYIGELLTKEGIVFTLDVYRNDALDIDEIKNRKYDRIILSPGPGDPSDRAYFGVCSDVIREVGQYTPVLGVCLGMQGIAVAFGGKVIRAKTPMHGKRSTILHAANGIFHNLPQQMEVMRYHSLIVDKTTLPDCLQITAYATESKEIMGLQHKRFPITGVQFHPESFATDGGMKLLENFILKHEHIFSNRENPEDSYAFPAQLE